MTVLQNTVLAHLLYTSTAFTWIWLAILALTAWIECYLDLVVVGARPELVTRSVVLHVGRFANFFEARYGHERISTVLKRDVEAWIALLSDDLALAPATVNSHLASLSKFCSWVDARHRHLFACGHPANGVRDLPLPALEPQALSPAQVLLLKSVCDRLPRFHERKGRRNTARRTTRPPSTGMAALTATVPLSTCCSPPVCVERNW